MNQTTNRSFALPALVAGLLTIGCGSSSPPAAPVPPAPPAVPASEFCVRWVEALCTANLSCCTDVTGRYTAMDPCVADWTARCESLHGLAVVDPRTAYDPMRGGEFVDRLRRAAATCAVDGAQIDRVRIFWDPSLDWRPFGAMFDGTVDRGGGCLRRAVGTAPAALVS